MDIPRFLLIRGCLANVPSQSAAGVGCGALPPGLARRSAEAEGLSLSSKEWSGVTHMEVNASVALVSSDDCKRLLGKSLSWLESSRGALQSFAVCMPLTFVSEQSQSGGLGRDSPSSEVLASSRAIAFGALFTHVATFILFKEFKLQSE